MRSRPYKGRSAIIAKYSMTCKSAIANFVVTELDTCRTPSRSLVYLVATSHRLMHPHRHYSFRPLHLALELVLAVRRVVA